MIIVMLVILFLVPILMLITIADPQRPIDKCSPVDVVVVVVVVVGSLFRSYLRRGSLVVWRRS